MADYDKMTSFDLYAKHKALVTGIESVAASGGLNALQNERMQKIVNEVQEIEAYARKNLSETKLDRDNSPVVNDYVSILKSADSEYKYEQEDELKKYLKEYDETYGLDGNLPDARMVEANQNAWIELTKDDTYTIPEEMQEDEAFKRLTKSDPETAKETLTLLRAMALTELALETPDEDQEEAKKRYLEKLAEVGAKYQTSVNTQLQTIEQSDEAKDEWVESYLKKKNLTKEQWNEATSNPQTKDAAQADYINYVISSVYTANNGVYTENNAIYASRMAQKVGLEQTVRPAAEQKRTFTQKHPKLMNFIKEGVKNMAQSGLAMAAVGPLGLTAMSGWKLKNAVMSSWKNYKNQEEEKTSVGGFFKYLRNNKEEAYNLAKQAVMFGASATFTAAMAATGTLGFGALGSVTGLGAASFGQAAAQTTVMGLTKMKMMGALTAVTSAGSYLFARQKLAPKKEALMEILQKYAPEQEVTAEKKGFFGKVFSKDKDPAKDMYGKLTGVWKDLGDEQKVMAMLESYAPNMTAEDKAQVLQLAKEVQNIKSGSYGALAGSAIGIGMAGGVMDAHAMSSDAPAVEPGNAGAASEWDVNKSLAENMQDSQYKAPLQTDMEQSNATVNADNVQADVSAEAATVATVEPHALSAEQMGQDTDLFRATQMGPTVIYKKLIDMGVMTQDDADKIMADEGRSYIPSRVLREHLQDDIKFTPEQEKEFNDFINDKATFQKLCDEENARAGIGIHHGGQGGHVHGNDIQDHTIKGDGQQLGDEQDERNEQDLSENEKKIVELKGRIKKTGLFNKKQEFEAEVESTGNFRNDVDAYAKAYAMHKKGITNPEDLDNAKYSVSGRMNDENGVEHKFKVKNNGDTHSTKIDGATVKTRSVDVGGTHQTVTTYKNVTADASTVGDANGTKPDKMIGAVSDDKGNHTVYVKDGDTKKIYEVKVDSKGGSTVAESELQNATKIKSALNNYGKGGQGR